jgi:hypothetical protein
MKFTNILGITTEEEQKSMKDKLKRKKYIGVCRCELSTTRIIKPKFPNAVITYIIRNRKNKGIWRSGWSVNPKEMNSVTKELFERTILLYDKLWTQEKG